MEVVYITIGVSVIIAVIFFGVFLMNIKKGQYEDTYTPSVRMLFDDENKSTKKNKENKENKDDKDNLEQSTNQL